MPYESMEWELDPRHERAFVLFLLLSGIRVEHATSRLLPTLLRAPRATIYLRCWGLTHFRTRTQVRSSGVKTRRSSCRVQMDACKITYGKTAEVLPMVNTPSGHLVMPCDNYVAASKTATSSSSASCVVHHRGVPGVPAEMPLPAN